MTPTSGPRPGAPVDRPGGGRTPVPHRRASTVVTVVVPALVLGGWAALASAWSDRLPHPLAVHWPASGGPDGFGSLAGFVTTILLIGLLLPALLWVISVSIGRAAAARRLFGGLAVGSAVMAAGVGVVVLHVQLDVADATTVGPLPAGWMAGSVASGVLAGALAGWAMPSDPPRPAATTPGGPLLDLPPRTTAAWVRVVVGRVVVWVAVAVIALFGVLAVAERTPWLVAIGLLIAAALSCFAVLRVSVDARGLTVRCLPGLRVVHVPLSEVEGARACTVSPFRDFGGWGYRIALDGRVGVVVRAGEAVEVTRSGGRVTVVTVDDAATGAALLTTLAAAGRTGV